MTSPNAFRAIGRWQLNCRRTVGQSFSRITRLGDFRLRHRVRPLCANLETTCPLLAGLSEEIEQRFLACGRALQEQVKLTSRLTEQSRQLDSVAARTSAGDTPLQRMTSLMGTHLALSDDLTREVKRLAVTLDRYAEHLQHLLHDQQQLERSFAPMRVLHSFFRIESAALSAEQQALFQAVTAEMQRLHNDVTASFAGHTAALEDTRQRVLAAAAELHAGSAQLLQVTEQKRADVQNSLTRLNAQFKKNLHRNQQLAAAVTSLDCETDAITVGLQYQDITRQKMEHVQAAAHSVLTQFTHPDDIPFERRTRTQQVICEVQVAQLGSVQEELDHATKSVSSGLRALLAHLQGIEQECLSVGSLQEITTGLDAALAEMGEIHRVTAELMRSALASLSQAVQIAHGFARATTGATDTMRRLAADLLLMGLNSQVQALQANNGCLEVLSSAVSNISSEAGTLTLTFEQKLASTTETLATFVHSSQAFHERTEAHHRALDAQYQSVLREFAAEQDTTKTLVSEVGSLLHQLASHADALLPTVDLADFSREPIARARDLFTALAAALAEAVPPARAEEDAILADVHSRYTMRSERAAHAAVIARRESVQPGGTQVAAPAASGESSLDLAEPVSAGRAGTDSLGDNVELF